MLDIRENELEQRQMEMAKIVAVLKQQEQELDEIIQSQVRNSENMEELYTFESLDIQQVESHRTYGIKLTIDAQNKERLIEHTKNLIELKRKEVNEAHKKVEILKKLKEKQEKEFYKEFQLAEIKETDDLTSARFNIG